MRIALTHNLQRSDAEEEAEFDRPETIAALCDALTSVGHVVQAVEVSGTVSAMVSTLESIAPDLVFNTAEGRAGRSREAFYPGLFEQLGLAFTGSDAWVCAVTLDKRLSKLVVAEAGVRTPKAALLTDPRSVSRLELRYPVIAKPNFEGSSKGITQDSVVADRQALAHLVEQLLSRYPSGVLVEEFIEGFDVTVPFLEGLDDAGVLEPAQYVIDDALAGPRAHSIYDYSLKQDRPEAVSVRVPAQISAALRREVMEMTERAVQACGIRDVGRVDFRISEDGTPFFIEVNALPSLEPGASLYESAARSGLADTAAVLDAIVRSAARRQGLAFRGEKATARKSRLRVGLAFNLKRGSVTPDDDAQAEFDAPETVHAIREAIEDLGHGVMLIEANERLPQQLASDRPDVVFNIAEGIRGRSREAQVPAVLELLDIEYTGSDAAALSLALDKHLAKQVVAAAGVAVPVGVVMEKAGSMPAGLTFPVVVKPGAEGSSKGVTQASLVRNEAELRSQVEQIVASYGGPALVETYLPGREFTVGLIGNRRPQALSPMEIVFLGKEPHPVYSFAHKVELDQHIRYDVPANIPDSLDRELRSVARKCFRALGCRDVARVDMRLDESGRVHFIECNPLPGLAPGFSDLCVIAERSGIPYRELIRRILAPALRRRRARLRA